MFENTFNYLKTKLFGNKEENKKDEEVEQKKALPSDVLLRELDYSNVPPPNIVNPNAEKSLLIVDDYDLSSVLYANDFIKLQEEFNKNVEEDFKVIRCLDKDSGLQAFKLICIDKVKIDYALLDLTLGCLIKLPNDQFVEVDGADLGIYIMELNPNAKIKFITMHTMHMDNFIVAGYAKKLKDKGIDLSSLYINKNSLARHKDIYNFLYKNK